jgi:hypothetical protein
MLYCILYINIDAHYHEIEAADSKYPAKNIMDTH